MKFRFYSMAAVKKFLIYTLSNSNCHCCLDFFTIHTMTKDPIKEQVSTMTLKEKIGQMLMLGIDGDSVNKETYKLIKDYSIGGIIFTKKNIKSAVQLLILTNDIKQTNTKFNTHPLFLSVDEEGGTVTRMPPEVKKLPFSYDIGKADDRTLAREVGEAIGERVHSFGFNMTMAPVLDINTNPKNPVIGKRSFGNSESLVSDLGIAEMKGIQSTDTIPIIKHFPGHGDTKVDSHKGLPILTHDLERLRSLEFSPFKKAIKKGADMVMIAHILLPQIDSVYPSSLSYEIITNILRGNLKFDGVVITDDLSMQAIGKTTEIGNAAVLAVEAGSDIILVNHGTENKQRVYQSLYKAVEDDRIEEERINESVYRILSLKVKYQLSDNPVTQVDINHINKSTDKIYQLMRP